jgi:hypothetical protein
LVCPILQASYQSQQILVEIILEQLNADLVDPGRSPVPFNVAESGPHQFGSNPPRQRMSFDLLGHGKALSC